jgi:hypothetical protein
MSECSLGQALAAIAHQLKTVADTSGRENNLTFLVGCSAGGRSAQRPRQEQE